MNLLVRIMVVTGGIIFCVICMSRSFILVNVTFQIRFGGVRSQGHFDSASVPCLWTPKGIFFRCGTIVHLDSRMNWFEFGVQKSIVKATDKLVFGISQKYAKYLLQVTVIWLSCVSVTIFGIQPWSDINGTYSLTDVWRHIIVKHNVRLYSRFTSNNINFIYRVIKTCYNVKIVHKSCEINISA